VLDATPGGVHERRDGGAADMAIYRDAW